MLLSLFIFFFFFSNEARFDRSKYYLWIFKIQGIRFHLPLPRLPPPPFNSSFYGWKDSKILFIVSRENSSPGRMTKCTFVFLLCTSQRHIDWSFLRCKFFASHFPIPFALSSPDIFTLPRVKLPRLSFLFQITGHSWISWWFYALSMYQILKLSIIWWLFKIYFFFHISSWIHRA